MREPDIGAPEPKSAPAKGLWAKVKYKDAKKHAPVGGVAVKKNRVNHKWYESYI